MLLSRLQAFRISRPAATFCLFPFSSLYPAAPLPLSSQVSRPRQETVWTVFRTTTRHTGSNPCRRSQRWTARPARQWPPPSPSTPASSTPTSPSTTEPPAAGLPTCPHPQPTPPASSTHRPQASRPPSDPPDSPPQSCYRVPLWTATEHTPTADTHPPTQPPAPLRPHPPDYHFITHSSCTPAPSSPGRNTHQSADY